MNNLDFPELEKQKKNQHFQDSEISVYQHFYLQDGRPVTARFWTDSGVTYVSYIFSINDLEEYDRYSLLKYLNDQGIKLDISFASKKSVLKKITDEKGGSFWVLTIIVDELEESIIVDARVINPSCADPILAKLWVSGGNLYVSYSFSRKEIEDYNNEDLFEYLNKQGIRIDQNMVIERSFIRKSFDECCHPIWTVILKIS